MLCRSRLVILKSNLQCFRIIRRMISLKNRVTLIAESVRFSSPILSAGIQAFD